MFKLIKFKPTSIRITLAEGTDKTAMIAAGITMQADRPELHLGVIDSNGIVVWTAV